MVGSQDDDSAFLDAAYLGMVHAQVSSVLMTSVKLEGKVGVGHWTLKPATRSLYGPANQALKVLGQFKGNLAHKEHSHVDTVYVVRGLRNNLLGLRSIERLQLVKRMEAMSTPPFDLTSRFPNVFAGLGTLGEEYTIRLKDDARPHALYTPRSVALPLRDKVHEELDRMEKMGVISKVNDPTPWCAGMVVVPKKSGAVRICVDLKALNENVLRETHPIPKVDDTLAQLTGAAVFSKLDANSGFWQIPLSDQSKLLTTFITPFGRYAFNKLPFGIASAPELFQKRMSKILEGLDGVVCLMDDVLVIGKDRNEHDLRLRLVLERVQKAKVMLNPTKCEFAKSSVKFLGHVIDSHGIRADPDKFKAICKMEAPHSVSDLRRFLGMVNQLGKFSPRIADLTQPMRELLSTKIFHVPGKLLYAADALSRAPMPETEDPLEVEAFVEGITKFTLPASKERLDDYRHAQKEDPVCAQVREYCTKQWPPKKLVSALILPYWNEKDSLSVCNDLLMFGSRIVVPKSLQNETLTKVHMGHQGIERCRMRVATSVR